MKKRILLGIVSLAYGFLCLFIGWLAGIDSGFDTGYRVAYLEMEGLLKQGIKERVSFYIKGLNVKFSAGKGDALKIAQHN